MDSYPSHFAYAASADANAYMSSLRYPGMGMTPMLGPMHMEPMYNAPITSEPAPSNALPCSSRIGNKSSSSFIYRYDDAHGASKIKCHQLCTSEGRLFVEHLPNHTILYIPNSSSIEQALCELRKPRSQTKQQKHNASLMQQQEQLLSQPQPEPQPPVVRKTKEKSAKPINAFIKYRSFKIAELKQQYPEVSQTEISRLAGECWKSEDEGIKNQFRVQYQEEKKVYDLKKAIGTGAKRARETSVTLSENDAASVLGDASAPLSDECGGSVDASLADVYPADFDPKRRRRSLTLPPTGASACVRSSSSSPMLQPQTASKRRRCVTTELRRQLAAKSSAIMATPPPPPPASVAPNMIASRPHSMEDEHNQYATAPAGGYYGDLSFAAPSMAGCGEHLVLSAHNSPAMMAAMHPHANSYLNDMSLPLNPAFGMHHQSDFASMSPPHLSSDGSVLSINTSFTGNGAASEHHSAPFDIYASPVHDDLANSVVNAHLVAANLSSFMAADAGYPHHATHHGLTDNIDSLSASEYFH
ncbi:hypothetical protein GGI01_003004 [Coemansia sp. RSA 376]|nr:hypothetical protein GGI01_003004 [Coemansia sp. RSA 376]